MMLNYRFNTNPTKSFLLPIVFIHGLFGNLSNFNSLSREFNRRYYNTLQIDLRNHGKSPHQSLMNYTEMAQDIFDVLDSLFISQCIVIGHSMGGKVAMTLPLLSKERVTKMIIIDIAPITYTTQNHRNIFTAINYINTARIIHRNEACNAMKRFLPEHKKILFLLKSFHHGKWDFNIHNIQKNYLELNEWKNHTAWPGEILFICGGHSSYIKKCYYRDIYQQFPNASIHIIDNAGHWVHVEKHNEILNIMNSFLL